MNARLSPHVPEYAIEAALLGAFMMAACCFGTLLEHPDSPVRQASSDPFARRVLMGLAMGLTAVALIHSPWGKRSGAHMNPATTLAFTRLGRVPWRDAAAYGAAQCAGAVLGVLLMSVLLGARLADPAVRYVVTAPGAHGAVAAFTAEIAMTFVLMSVVLAVSASRHARWTAACVGLLLAAYITFEAPVSGMSLNPARTLGSAVAAGVWDSAWIYWIAPPLGMLLAAEVHARVAPAGQPACAKLHHQNTQPCIFCAARESSRRGRAARSIASLGFREGFPR